MQNDILKNIETLNKATMDSAKRLGDINMRIFEKLTQRNFEATADYLDGSMQQFKLMGESKDIQAAAKEQARLGAELNEKFVEHAKKTAEVLTEVKGELTDWAKDGMNTVGTPLHSASNKSA
jgi:phasin family protein